ncbi:MAG: transglycosylase family protein, partial [Brevibacterium yomogidense]
WYNIVKCESEFNPRAVNQQNNAHFGLFQFKIASWQGVGGSGNPADAHPREQFKRAKMLQQQYGWGQWACA